MANANYVGVNAGTSYAALAYAVEQYVNMDWEKQYLRTHPFLDKVWQAGKGKKVSIDGPKALIPIWLSNGSSWSAITRANENADITAAQGDGTMAEAPWCNLVARQEFTQTELKRLRTYAHLRGSIIQGRADELSQGLLDTIITQMWTNQNAAENQITGLPYICSTSNTVHGINQSTDTTFASNVTTSAGLMTEVMLDSAISKLRREKSSKPDCIAVAALASGGSIDLITRIKSVLSASTLLMRNVNEAAGTQKYGYDNFEFRGCTVFGDQFMTNGEVYILDSTKFVLVGDMKAKAVRMGEPIPKRLAYENVYECPIQLMCAAPRAQWKFTGVSG